ncbi:STAG domain containing protein [Trypanosoma brucei equiperdum]|uniref:STAG domain containing protein n=1 Tax=Trypanosoma brucei equiperdum TaxID=630700 RepID=A0A3L6L158_9TRYP|nr:STAG domain containing protein [Trypanosoma brucei equiperdum]
MPRKVKTKVSQKPKAAKVSPTPKNERERPKNVDASGKAAKLCTEEPTAPVIVSEEGTSLMESLFTALAGGVSPSRVASDVLRLYCEGNRQELCAAILNLVGKVSGVVDGELGAAAVEGNTDMNTLLDEMFAHVPENAPAYLFSQRDPKSQKLRIAYGQFFMRLVELSYSENLMFDQFLLPTVVAWLVAMSESKARCFRHTSTATLLYVVDALSCVIQTLNGQVCADKRNKKHADAKQRVIQAVVEQRNQILTQTVHQRARDVAPEIRLLVFESLKGWILKFDEEFAENKYFRYFGMALYDKRPEIRAEALAMIQETLDSIPDSGSRMFLFLQYFSKRLVEMCNDVNLHCSQLAIGVIRRILRIFSAEAEDKQLLNNEMIDSVLLNIFSECPTIRREAGALLHDFIETRLPTDERDESAGLQAMTELLCTFAAMLRSQHGEMMPERYIVDSLYTPPQDIPPLLREYGPILKLAQSDAATDVVVALGFLSALLEKLRGRTDLGPIPKDDRKGAQEKKISADKQEAITAVIVSMSRDVGVVLTGVLERHRSDVAVVGAVAAVISAMDMEAFTSLQDVSQIKSLLVLMRKVTAALPHSDQLSLVPITGAWHALVSEEHPLVVEAKGQLQELRRQVVKQLTANGSTPSRASGEAWEREQLHLWTRVCIVSSLVPMGDLLTLFKSSFLHHVEARASPELIQLVLTSLVRCVLWQLREAQEQTHEHREPTTPGGADDSGATSDVRDAISQLIGELFRCVSLMWTAYAEHVGADATGLLVDGMLILCDLCVLPHYILSEAERNEVLDRFAQLSQLLGSKVTSAREELKKAEAGALEGDQPIPLAPLRRKASYLESSQMRVSMGVARLMMLKRLPESAGPRVLAQWGHAPTKAVSDIFRCLFRKLRDHTGDSLSLEWSVLLAAREQSADSLSAVGVKLSSMHWPLPDKYYSACVGIVRCGIEFAATVDPTVLLALVPYCSRLLRNDAVALVSILSQREKLASSTDHTVMAFVSSLRRAAKLDGTPNILPASVTKRPRDISPSLDLCGNSLPEHMPAPRFAGKGGVSPQTGNQRSSLGTHWVGNRMLSADGWRIPHKEVGTNLSCAGKVGMEGSNLTASSVEGEFIGSSQETHSVMGSLPTVDTPTLTLTQRTNTSCLDGFDNSEVFIATMEYE